MDTQGIHVMTIANSIIGVSILAMPYCFKQCGILLSILMLILSSIISRLACHFLLKSAIKARLRTFEFLAYHAFGALGKFVIEIGMIGFLLGTCIAFFVVMGDLGPQIVAQMADLKTTNTLRTGVLIALALFCVLPLGLLRNVDSLSGVCTATIGFYICLVVKIIAESAPHILVGDWYYKVDFWRWEGVLQCIPIFSMALFCQTQLFEVYQAIPNASLEKMNGLIRVAVNICTSVYIFVGVFGYIALSNESFSGNILMNFKPSLMTEIMKMGFVLSVAFSFPLIIFPCRASLFSLLYKPTCTLHDTGTNYIPEIKFRCLTVFIVALSLLIGILIPNIELVLGLVGSTIGVMICVLFPATCFICMSTKNTNERILAQVMLFIGIIVMVLGTYANLYAFEEATLNPVTEKIDVVHIHMDHHLKDNSVQSKDNAPVLLTTMQPHMPLQAINNKLSLKIEENNLEESLKEIRHEPPQPVEPEEAAAENVKEVPKLFLESASDEHKSPAVMNVNGNKPVANGELNIKLKEVEKKNLESIKLESLPGSENTKPKPVIAHAENAVADQVDIEAIKKEDKEIFQQESQKQNELEKKVLMDQLFRQHEKILKEYEREKALRNEKEQNEIDQVRQEKLKAVREIESIAKQAIKSLVEEDNVKPKLSNPISKMKPDSVNPEVMSYKLGLNFANNSNSNVQQAVNLSHLVPIPIAKSHNLSIFANISENVKQALNSTVHNKNNLVQIENGEMSKKNEITSNISLEHVKQNSVNLKSPLNVKLNNTANSDTHESQLINNEIKPESNIEKSKNEGKEEIQAMRRDILSDKEYVTREKRSANEVCGNSNSNNQDYDELLSPRENGMPKHKQLIHDSTERENIKSLAHKDLVSLNDFAQEKVMLPLSNIQHLDLLKATDNNDNLLIETRNNIQDDLLNLKDKILGDSSSNLFKNKFSTYKNRRK